MSHPIALQPGATGPGLQGPYGKWHRDSASWYTTDTTTDGVNHPAASPGTAPIVGACGVHKAGNGDKNCGTLDSFPAWNKKDHADEGGQFKDAPYYGDERYCDNRRYLSNASAGATWTAGGTAEVSWTSQTNHFGAIGYRLCPLATVQAHTDYGSTGPTEECFQQGHLAFATDETCVRCGDDASSEVCYQAPTVKGKYGNVYRRWDTFVSDCQDGESPQDHCAAPTKTPCTQNDNIAFSLFDKVKVPAGLSGQFVLGFRWDCKHTPQVWQNCAIINIQASSETEVSV